MLDDSNLPKQLKSKLTAILAESVKRWNTLLSHTIGENALFEIIQINLLSMSRLLLKYPEPHFMGKVSTSSGKPALIFLMNPKSTFYLLSKITDREINTATMTPEHKKLLKLLFNRIGESFAEVLAVPGSPPPFLNSPEVDEEHLKHIQDAPDKNFITVELELSIENSDKQNWVLILPFTMARLWAENWSRTEPVSFQKANLPEYNHDVKIADEISPGKIFREIPVSLKAFVGRKKISLSSLVKLGPGAFMPLSPGAEEDAELTLGGKTLARGQVVVVNGNYGLLVSEICVHGKAVRRSS